MIHYLLLIVGFILLVKGADAFVSGASDLAKKFGIPTIIIGLTIVAFGTSAPEAAVSITAALSGQSDMSIGNAVGSNIFNLLFILGIAAMLMPIGVEKDCLRKDIPFSFLAAIALMILGADVFLAGASENVLTRGDGLILLLFFAVFMYYLTLSAFKKKDNEKRGNDSVNLKKAVIFSILGLLGIIVGGNLVVKSATWIALSLGMSEALVGLTVVSLGTSLPELVTSVIAAIKKESDIALGNIIGSNIFNLLFVLGAAAVVGTLKVNSIVFIDIAVLLVSTIITCLFAKSRQTISKKEGVVFLIMYLAYFIFIIIRG